MSYPPLVLAVPAWVEAFLADRPESVPTLEERMRLVLTLARLAMEHGGGPFAAAVFERSSGRLIAPGVNVVLTERCSVGHAEVMAVAVAQRVIGHHSLGAPPSPACELVTSTEPCAQCFGVIALSGLGRVICGARTADAEAIGFDEGPKPGDWAEALARRGVETRHDLLREEAAEVLAEYRRRGLPIYHGRGPSG